MNDPVLVQLGARPKPYPADVASRLGRDADTIVARYSAPENSDPAMARSALLPLLHLVQAEDGYITGAGIEFCADRLGLTGAEVTSVATFYSMYRREPTGDYLVGVCTNTLCAVMGGDAIAEALYEHTRGNNTPGSNAPGGNTPGDVDPVTIVHIECNAACDYAPVVMVNWEFFDNQTPESARALVDALRSGEEVVPTRGASLCTFRETERILAGFPDERLGAAQAGGTPGDPTLAGLRVAREMSMSAPPVGQPSDTGAAPLGSEEGAAAKSTEDKPAPAPGESVPPEKGN